LPRIKKGVTKKQRHKKILRMAKGYWGAKSKLFRPANEQVIKSLAYAYAHRKKRKSDFRRLWITRISVAARLNGISYSQLINGLQKAGVEINRKVLAELAIQDSAAFSKMVEIARGKLSA
jgi:large subunit ribosomal protein L20